jgi:ketosteroid isomerase-like protein
MRRFVTAAVVSGFLVGCSSSSSTSSFSDADVTALRATGDAYVKAFREGDWTAWADFYAPDAMILAPNAPVIRGRDAMRQWARGLPPITTFTRTTDEVEGSGDMAYLRGGYQLVLSPPGGPAMADSGKFIQIWRKQAGTWKAVRAIFNSDLSAAVAPR